MWRRVAQAQPGRHLHTLSIKEVSAKDLTKSLLATHLDQREPVLIRGWALDWSACALPKNGTKPTDWPMWQGLRQLKDLPLMVERGHWHEGTFSRNHPTVMADFLDELEALERCGAESTPLPIQRAHHPYMAQFDLLAAAPELRAGLRPAHEFLPAPERLLQTLLWLGPAGTETPLHLDPYHNLFVQLLGRKSVTLVQASSPSDRRLYRYPSLKHRNLSRVNVTLPITELNQHFPGFLHMPQTTLTLDAGDALYIPRGLHHDIRSLTTSCSVSYWWT